MDALAVGVGQLQQVVGLETQHVEGVILGSLQLAVGAVSLVQLLDTAAVHTGRVGQHGAEDIVLGQLIVLCHLNAAQHVGDAGDTQPSQLLDERIVQTKLVLQICLTICGVEQAQQTLGVLIVDGDSHIGILHVVDPGDVLIADTLDAVTAEAVVKDGGALQCFTNTQLHGGIQILQTIACAHGAGRAGGEAGTSQTLTGLLHSLVQVCQSVTGDIVVPQGVAHLLKLVEDHHGGIGAELPSLVEDLLDVGLAARGGDDLTGDLAEPVETLLGHLGRQDGHAVAGQQLGVESAAAAVVTGGGPHGMMISSIELTGHQTGSQAAEGGTHLMAARGEPLACHGEDAALDTGEDAGDLHIVGDGLIQAAEILSLVLPSDTEEVDRIHIPQAGICQLCLDLLRDQIGILHLCEGGDDDVVFLGLGDVVCKTLLVNGQIDHFFFSSCCLLASM